MEDDLITTKEVGDYRIKVYYCRDSECPITNWGLFGSFFFEYSDTHRLHDECKMLYIILTRTLCLSTGTVMEKKSHRKSLMIL